MKEEKDTKEEKVITTKKAKGKEKEKVPKEKVSENKETKDKDESKAEQPKVVEEQGNIHDQVKSLIDKGMNEEDTKEKIDTLKGILACWRLTRKKMLFIKSPMMLWT